MPSTFVWKTGTAGDEKQEGWCQQRSGCHTSVTVAAARAQRVPEHDKDGHGAGFGHIPQALHHTPGMGVFAHLSSFSCSASRRLLSRLWYLLSSQKGLFICPLTAVPSAPGRVPASPLDRRFPTAAGHETQKLPGPIPWKADRAHVACPSHSQHT